MSLLELFDSSLLARASREALAYTAIDGRARRATFGELESRSNRLARTLAARGLVAGDRLAFFLGNRLEIVDLWIACAKLGVIVVPMNVLYRERELRHIVGDAAPRAVVTTAAQAPDLPSGTPWWDIEALNLEASSADGARPAVNVSVDTPAALVYTSGTTGASKGAVLTHGNFVSNARALCDAWRITDADRFLSVLPLFHVHGLGNGVHCWLASGCHMRLEARFDHATAADVLDEYRPTLFFGVPTIYVRLLEVDPARARRIGAEARLFVSGSAPLPPQVLDQFRDLYGHVILERYGMTETLMNVSNPYDGERRPGTVGFPLPHVDVRIVDADGQDVARDEMGELWVRGPNVCSGYWGRADATATAFAGGWFRTGDLGSRAADGYITLHGRRSDLIISGGFNIYPREIEELLLEQPGIREAAVVGVPDSLRGEVPVAYVVTDSALDVLALDERLRTQLASFKIPRGFVEVAQLPRTALGKVQKHLLPPWKAS
jgi:malonyl-CoA/methylmalonyl-CoA synthetase